MSEVKIKIEEQKQQFGVEQLVSKRTTKIQWTEHTWNPFHGCKKVSDGCKYCYMYRDKERYGQEPTKVIRSSKSVFNKPLHIKEPSLIFTCSWSDFFIEEADGWRSECWQIIKNTPHHTYQILTKRPENILSRLPKDWGSGYKNVWLGVSIENEEHCHRMITLQHIAAKVRFISYEPLLNETPFSKYIFGDVKEWLGDEIYKSRIHWIIIGGESGNENGKYKYRPCKIEWIEQIINEAKELRTPVFVKQLGTYLAKQLNLKDKFGGDISEFPEHLKIREMPHPS